MFKPTNNFKTYVDCKSVAMLWTLEIRNTWVKMGRKKFFILPDGWVKPCIRIRHVEKEVVLVPNQMPDLSKRG